MELSSAEDVESTLVPKDLPEETRTKSMKKPAMVAVAIGIILVIVVAAAVVIVVIMSKKGPAGEDRPDGALWIGNPLKRPFTVTLTTTGSEGAEGQLQLCGQEAGCCTTGRFVFEAPTLINLEEHQNCSKFELNKDKGMSIKVLNDDPDNVKIERIVMILDGGASFHGFPTEALTQSTWSPDITLRAFNRRQSSMMKVNFRRDQDSCQFKTAFIDGARIEIKRRGESVAKCISNPLKSNPLPRENRGTFELDDLETLGTCFGNSIKGAGDSLMIRFRPPATCMPYTVTRITLKSHEEQTSGWWVKLKQQDEGNDGWITATFDDDFIG